MDNDIPMAQQKFMMTVPEQMNKFLEAEMKARGLDSVQETIRQIISAEMKRKAED
jgi:hypothetical protein